MNNIIMRKNKRLIVISIGILVLVISVVIFFSAFPHTHRNLETVTVYYQPQDAMIKTTQTAVLRGEDAEKIESFLDGLKFNADIDDTLTDINEPAYKIEGEHENSSGLNFNYYIYVRKNHYIVMNAFEGTYALAYQKDYDYLELFLSDGNLGEFQSGPTYP